MVITRRSLLLTVAAGGLAPHTASAASAVPDDAGFASRRDAYLALVRAAPLSRVQFGEGGTIRFVTPDPGKHLWSHLLALLAVDPSGSTVLPGADTQGVTVRQLAQALFRYPNMFHFNADGPAACLLRHPGLIAPNDRRFLMEGHDRSVLHHPDQPNYNLFTGEGTENHLAMSRFPGYLLCQDWLQDHPDDNRARQGLAQTREYILRHARDVYHAGPGEFNSSTYYGYQLRGILSCFEFAADPVVRNACRALLDYFAAEIALKYVQGINAGPESRGGDDRSVTSEMNQMVWLWFGDSPVAPATVTNAVYAALSRYRPPALLGAIARKEEAGGEYWNAHPTYLLDTPAASRESLYFGRGYALGCLYLSSAGYTGATEQFRPAKLVCRSRDGGDPTAWVLFANSNARTEHGGGRGPYDQWAHHRDTLIQLTHVPAHAAPMAGEAEMITKEWRAAWLADFAVRWGGRGDSDIHGPRTAVVQVTGIKSYLIFPQTAAADYVTNVAKNLTFLRHDDVYVAIRSLKNALPTREEPTAQSKPPGKTRLMDTVGSGETGGFVLEVGTLSEDGAFEAFQKRIAETTELDVSQLQSTQTLRYRNRRGEWVSVQYNRVAPAAQIEPQFDWGYIKDPAKNRPTPVPTVPPLRQPAYPRPGTSLDGWGRVPTVTVDGKPLGGTGFLDLKSPWPVFRGPNITLENSVLTITVGTDRYRVDHSSDTPRWSGTV